MNGSPLVTCLERLLDTQSDLPEFPRHQSPTTPPASEDTAQIKPKRSLHILCIDDDVQILEFMNDYLTHFKHQVVVAASGRQGLELFRAATLKNQPYEVVITDLGMPDMDGSHVARTIKAESPHTPVIMMTGWGNMANEDGETTPVVDIVVPKPPQMQELNSLLLRMAPPARLCP